MAAVAMTADEREARTQSAHHSSLYKKRLPKFEASSSYEDYARNDQRIKPREDESASTAASAGKSADAQPQETTLEAQTSKCLEAVGAQNSLREILYKLLAFCTAERSYAEAESFLQSCDEYIYSHIIQSPASLIQIMVGNCGIEKTALDASGKALNPDLLATLDADEADDLTCGYALKTTEAGAAVVAMLDPAKRFAAQLARNRGRIETFNAILDFCAQSPRKFPAIKSFYDEHDEFDKDTAVDAQALAADFYVDKLEKAGMLVWRGQWGPTSAGRDYLAQLTASTGLEE